MFHSHILVYCCIHAISYRTSFSVIRPQCYLGLMLFCKTISNLGRLIVVCCVGFHRIDLDDLFLQFIYQHCINQMIATTTTVSLLMKTHLKRTITPPLLVRHRHVCHKWHPHEYRVVFCGVGIYWRLPSRSEWRTVKEHSMTRCLVGRLQKFQASDSGGSNSDSSDDPAHNQINYVAWGRSTQVHEQRESEQRINK